MHVTKLVALAMLALAACSPDATPSRVIAPEAPSFARGVSKLWIDPATLTLRVGETVTVTAWAGKRVSTQPMLLWGCQEYGCNAVIAIASPASGPTVSVTGLAPGVATVYAAYGDGGWGYTAVTVTP